MPHLHVEKFNEFELPQSFDGVTFDFVAQNHHHADERLIAARVEDDDFFLIAKEEEGRKLLKSDKLTRPASIYNVHKALLNFAKMTDLHVLASNVPENEKNVHLKEVSALKDIEYFASNFPMDREIRIEVGFGSGRHLLHQAMNNPDILFIGLEIYNPSIEQVLKQINIKKIDNLLVLNYDARLFMELVPSNIVGKIYVHFPVPWDKKPHRRVISTTFIEESRRVLKVGGTLELRTDSENYYAYSYETFIAFNKTILHINKNRDIEVSSKYEDRWKKMQKNIYDVTMINEETSDDLSLEGDFKFAPVTRSHEEILNLHGTTQKFQNEFVHFERVYTTSNGVMLRVSMGSFSKPEHIYIVVKGTEASYYPSEVLRSKSNIVAHRYINEVLHG